MQNPTLTIGGNMKKHIHFLLLVSGTAVFLLMMHRYTAPLILNNDYQEAEQRLGLSPVNYTVLNMNSNSLHTTYIVKASLWAFATYLSFVVIIFAHRLFYKPYRNTNQEIPPVSN